MTQTSTIPTKRRALTVAHAPFFVFEEVSWEFYEKSLEEMERNNRHIRISYDEGKLEFMVLTNRHEQHKKLIARFIEMYAMDRDIPLVCVGSVTLKQKHKKKGLEPDECYYVATPAPPAKVMQLDLKKYPPPNLAIEIDITHGSMNRQPIYGAIGIPEIWRFDGTKIIVLHRRRDGNYRPVTRSAVFPRLSIAVLNGLITMADSTSQNDAARAFRDWLRENP